MANSNHPGDGAPPRDIHVGPDKKKAGWIPWLLLALGLLALIFGLRSCQDDDNVARTEVVTAPVTPAPVTTPAEPMPATDTAAVPAGTSGLGSYLAGTEALPRTFTFEKLYFDTGKSEIREQDREELNTLAAAMNQYPNSRIRIIGYADARGTPAINLPLGKERAESVKQALVAQGVAAERIETASGGEAHAAANDGMATSQAENRRAELIVLQR